MLDKSALLVWRHAREDGAAHYDAVDDVGEVALDDGEAAAGDGEVVALVAHHVDL